MAERAASCSPSSPTRTRAASGRARGVPRARRRGAGRARAADRAFLRGAPVPTPSEDDRRYLGLARGGAAAARTARRPGLRVDEVVDRLVAGSGSTGEAARRSSATTSGSRADARPAGVSSVSRSPGRDPRCRRRDALSLDGSARHADPAFLRQAVLEAVPPVAASSRRGRTTRSTASSPVVSDLLGRRYRRRCKRRMTATQSATARTSHRSGPELRRRYEELFGGAGSRCRWKPSPRTPRPHRHRGATWTSRACSSRRSGACS